MPTATTIATTATCAAAAAQPAFYTSVAAQAAVSAAAAPLAATGARLQTVHGWRRLPRRRIHHRFWTRVPEVDGTDATRSQQHAGSKARHRAGRPQLLPQPRRRATGALVLHNRLSGTMGILHPDSRVHVSASPRPAAATATFAAATATTAATPSGAAAAAVAAASAAGATRVPTKGAFRTLGGHSERRLVR